MNAADVCERTGNGAAACPRRKEREEKREAAPPTTNDASFFSKTKKMAIRKMRRKEMIRPASRWTRASVSQLRTHASLLYSTVSCRVLLSIVLYCRYTFYVMSRNVLVVVLYCTTDTVVIFNQVTDIRTKDEEEKNDHGTVAVSSTDTQQHNKINSGITWWGLSLVDGDFLRRISCQQTSAGYLYFQDQQCRRRRRRSWTDASARSSDTPSRGRPSP